MLIATLAGVKWHQNQQKNKIAEHESEQSVYVEAAIANTNQAFGLPMEKAGAIQDYAEFGKVARFANLFHSAIDYFAKPGTEVFAVADGEVYFSGAEGGYGALVVITHDRPGIYSLYGHVSAKRWLVEQGVQVKKGQLIGYTADTNEGYGIGVVPHLHFSIRLGNPEDYPNSGRDNWMTGYTQKHPAFYNFVDPEQFIQQTKIGHRE